MQATIALRPAAANYNIEGPTQKQARKMATYRKDLLTKAQVALEAGDDGRAFDLDCRAMDVECDLNRFGFNVETGRPVR